VVLGDSFNDKRGDNPAAHLW